MRLRCPGISAPVLDEVVRICGSHAQREISRGIYRRADAVRRPPPALSLRGSGPAPATGATRRAICPLGAAGEWLIGRAKTEQ